MPKKNNKQNKHEDENDIIEDEAEFSFNSSSEVKKLKEKLKKCREERQEYLDGWQRAKADFINYKNKEEERRKEGARYAREDVVTQLLPVIDSFEMAFRDKEVWGRVDKNWTRGIEHIYSQLLKILEENGVSQDNPLGEAFDPNVHESVSVAPTKKKEEDGIILEVHQKGYLLGERVVRPARVIVGQYMA